MKQILLIACLAISTIAQAQITLLHTFEGNGWQPIYTSTDGNQYWYSENITIPSQKYYYESLDAENNTFNVTIVDASFNIESEKKYKIVPVSGYKPFSVIISKTIFDDDETTKELAVCYQKDDNNYNNNQRYQLILYTEDGTQIYDFGYSYSSMYVQPFLHYFNNEYRFWLTKSEYDAEKHTTNIKYEVYRVSKTKATGLQQMPLTNQLPYPNPANSIITLPYNLQQEVGSLYIYDQTGKQIERRYITRTNNQLQLNVSNYPAGQYIYTVEGQTQTFIVK